MFEGILSDNEFIYTAIGFLIMGLALGYKGWKK